MPPLSPHVPDHLDRVGHRQRRPWRRCFVAVAIALTVATHWPALALGDASPVSDKLVHALSFGALTILLWQTRWLRRRVTVVLVALAWSILDEATQGLPFIRRHAAWQDGLANTLGVLVAGAWLWASAPVGGVANRTRLAVEQFVFDELWVRGRPWLVFVAIVLAAGVAGAAIPFRPPGTTWAGIGLFAGITAASATLAVWWSRGCHALNEQRPCFACGASCRTCRFDETGRGVCPVCGAELRATQWQLPSRASGALRGRLLVGPVMATTGILALVLGAMTLLPLVYPRLLRWPPTSRLAPDIAAALGRLPQDLSTVIDLTGALLTMAVFARLYRTRLARAFDQGERCRRCGHDLRGTPVRDGHGRCSECGTEFVVG